jgi:hypothetical protein
MSWIMSETNLTKQYLIYNGISNQNLNCQISVDDKIKVILQILARIEYENYLEIKGKCNSPNLVMDECRKFSLTSVNCKAA